MGISRSTYYYKPKDKPSDMDLAEKIEEIALDFPSYGYRRITAQRATPPEAKGKPQTGSKANEG